MRHLLHSEESQKTKRLSLPRLFILLILLGVAVFATRIGIEYIKLAANEETTRPWFGAYVDVTTFPQYAFEEHAGRYNKNVILSFVVADKTDSCQPSWGGVYSLELANSDLELGRRIARYRQLGGNVAVSFGGLKHDELALACNDIQQLLEAYQSVIDTYQLDTIDIDLEGAALEDQTSLARRAEVIAHLQQLQYDKDKPLAVWLTLPVTPLGLTDTGIGAVSAMLEAGVDLTGVNAMVMNYGASLEREATLIEGTENALRHLHRQLGVLYSQHDVRLLSSSLWAKIGATPMIGQNDVLEEVFTTEDATALNEFSHLNGLRRLSMWSANRDGPCSTNQITPSQVSDTCSGLDQSPHEFALLLSNSFTASLSDSSGETTVSDADEVIHQDDPERSPYPIWSDTDRYPAGTKIVWRRNVYQAKWWTQGDNPDRPVLQSWETPWRLLGPVLPGEKPAAEIVIPRGVFPEWSNTKQYKAGDRVLFEGVAFQAKWWNQGDNPGISFAQQDESPWQRLSTYQLEVIINP